ncbi:hypothetical protein ACJZ2D_009391 [Fusarium nematophilum]
MVLATTANLVWRDINTPYYPGTSTLTPTVWSTVPWNPLSMPSKEVLARQAAGKARKIARKACDLCRSRRMQCTFPVDSSAACQRCLQHAVPCTFLMNRKPRGPPSRHVAEARQRAAAVISQPEPLPLPLGVVGVAHLLPEPVFQAVINDFLFRVYPLVPFIHMPRFKAQLAARNFETDPAFFRLCVALCAITVASLPRNLAMYGSTGYRDAIGMVDRASQLITCSYMTTMPSWQDEPSAERLNISILEAVAFLYVGRIKTGYLHMGDAIQCCRDLGLCRSDTYQGLDPVGVELRKRLFWLLFISQVHDRMDDLVPRSGLSYYPRQTDWEFLLPKGLSDEELSGDGSPDVGSTPVISGFVALVKLYIAVFDHLEEFFPCTSPMHVLSPGGVAGRVLRGVETYSNQAQVQSTFPMLDSLLQVTQRLNTVVDQLPEALRLPRDGERMFATDDDTLPAFQPNHQFRAMSANIHMTAIYLQSILLEVCSERWQTYQKLGEEGVTRSAPIDESVSTHLWSIKASLAQMLLDFLECLSGPELESNGHSMIVKIRQVASIFLNQESNIKENSLGFIDSFSRQCLDKVLNVLIKIDYLLVGS